MAARGDPAFSDKCNGVEGGNQGGGMTIVGSGPGAVRGIAATQKNHRIAAQPSGQTEAMTWTLETAIRPPKQTATSPVPDRARPW